MAVATLSFGSSTSAGRPAAAQYAASAAEVSPVLAQATARTLLPRRIISRTAETSTVMPRSLKEPVWLLPHCFTQRSRSPMERPYRSAQRRFDPPSAKLTMLSSAMPG
jgi:hypothetical protein